MRSEEHTSELQSPCNLVCRLLLEKKKETDRKSTRLNSIHLVISYADFCLKKKGEVDQLGVEGGHFFDVRRRRAEARVGCQDSLGVGQEHQSAASFHVVFFFNDPATPEVYTLFLRDALPI